jgi:progressive ankylosis protein
MTHTESKLTYKKILLFWIPLALSWAMMAIEGPFLAAVIARLVDSKINLAAYGVAFSLALIMEAPIIMITSAMTSLCKDKDSFLKLRRFITVLNIIITLVMLILLIPFVFLYFADLMGLEKTVASLTYRAVVLLLPWPAAIGYRRFYQGVLILNNKTRRVTYGTIVRLGTMASTAMVLFFLNVTGVLVGAAALSMGVIGEAVGIRIMAHQFANNYLRQKPNPLKKDKTLTFTYITKFYYPLALMTILTLGVHPMITFFMGKSRYPLESLAVLPVVNSLTFIFRAIGLSYQEVVITFLGKSETNYAMLRNFGLMIGCALVLGLGLIAYTPLSEIWFYQISGLSKELTEFSYVPIQILAFLPGFSVLLTFQWATLMYTRKTFPISWSTSIEVTMIIVSLAICVYYFQMIGAVAATVSYAIGRICSNLFLAPFSLRAARHFKISK